MNSKQRRAMIHRGAIQATRATFTPEAVRLESQIKKVERWNSFHRAALTYKDPHSMGEHEGVSLIVIPTSKQRTVNSRISSASIPDSFVSRTDNTDRLYRARDTRSFYAKRDRLVSAAIGIQPTVRPMPAKVIAWAKSKGLM